MLDIHTHLIPYIDDGSASYQTSLDMARNLVLNNTTKCICTPHHLKDVLVISSSEIKEKFETLKKLLKENNIPLDIYLGMEIKLDTSEDIIELLKKEEVFTLNNTNIVLIEFSESKRSDYEEYLRKLFDNNYRVIIAHVERYINWITLDDVKRLKELGCMLQVNADSVVKKNGLKMYNFTKKLLSSGCVDFIASDTHAFRPSHLLKAMKKTNFINDEKIFNL